MCVGCARGQRRDLAIRDQNAYCCFELASHHTNILVLSITGVYETERNWDEGSYDRGVVEAGEHCRKQNAGHRKFFACQACLRVLVETNHRLCLRRCHPKSVQVGGGAPNAPSARSLMRSPHPLPQKTGCRCRRGMKEWGSWECGSAHQLHQGCCEERFANSENHGFYFVCILLSESYRSALLLLSSAIRLPTGSTRIPVPVAGGTICGERNWIGYRGRRAQWAGEFMDQVRAWRFRFVQIRPGLRFESAGFYGSMRVSSVCI